MVPGADAVARRRSRTRTARATRAKTLCRRSAQAWCPSEVRAATPCRPLRRATGWPRRTGEMRPQREARRAAAACAAAACAAAAACNELPLGALTSPRRGAQQRKSASAAACSRRAPSPGGSDSSPSVGDARDRSPSPVQGIKAFEPNTSDLFLFGAKPPTLPLGDARRRPSVVTDEATLLDSVRHVASRREEQTMQKQVSCDLNPNVGTLQEVVFGYVGEGAKPLGEPPPEFPRKARLGRSTGPPLHWTANHRNEVGEIAFGKSAPDPELAAHRRRGVPVPRAPDPGERRVVTVEEHARRAHGLPLGGRVRLQRAGRRRAGAGGEPGGAGGGDGGGGGVGAARGARGARARHVFGRAAVQRVPAAVRAAGAQDGAAPLGHAAHRDQLQEDRVDLRVQGPEAIDPKGHGDGSRTGCTRW